MTSQQFRKLALSFDGVIESAHQGHPDFRYGGKVIASLGAPDDSWAMVKLTPDQQAAMLQIAPDAFRPCSGAWGRAGCTNLKLSAAKVALAKSALKLAVENQHG